MRTSVRPTRLVFRISALTTAATVGGAAGVAAASVVLPHTGLLVAVLFGLWISLLTLFGVNSIFGGLRDSREGETPDLRRALRDDRNVLLLIGVAMPMLTGVRSAVQWGWWMGVQQFARTSVLLLIVLGAANIGVPWLRFTWTRLVLASTGRIPLRFVTFLEDAHRRGVLRSSGATYEFRHATFLSYLGGSSQVGRDPEVRDRGLANRQ